MSPTAAAFAFRHRFLIIPALLVVSLTGAYALANVGPFPALVGLLSLPRGALLFGGPASAWPWLALPFALVLPGSALRLWGTSYVRGEVMRHADVHADRLVIAGPFRFTRNPLYLGNMILAVSYGLLLPPPGLLISIALMLAMSLALIRAEEPALAAAHPEAFAQYARAVPRLLPRLTPARGLPTLDVRPEWRGAVKVELAIALFFTAAIVAVVSVWAGVAVYLVGLLILGPGAKR